VIVTVSASHEITAQVVCPAMKSSGEIMDIIAAYREVGNYRGAADMCGTTHKTVKRIIERALAGDKPPGRIRRERNFDAVADLVAEKVKSTAGKISAKRLLPLAQACSTSSSARATSLERPPPGLQGTAARNARSPPRTRIGRREWRAARTHRSLPGIITRLPA
jgi:hypothetical protein